MEIVFILNGISQPRCLKRIKEFIDNGYQIKVYGFDRHDGVKNNPGFPIEIIGEMQNRVYSHRFKTMWRGLRHVFKSTDKNNSVYYLFGLDNVLFSKLLCPRMKYIFEESDLRHVELKSKFLRDFLEILDRRAIKKSLMTVFTSDGFIEYHFNGIKPDNTFTIPNRLDEKILNCELLPAKPIDMNHLSIGFVGGIRYKSIMFFAEYFSRTYPQHEFHFFGSFKTKEAEEKSSELKKLPNCFFHGAFESTVELPSIYSQIDMVLSTYDIDNINVRYAEPNKLYESIYFETPIIVSKGTFLADKVKDMNVGYAINAMDANEIDTFFQNLKKEDLEDKVDSIRKYDKMIAISKNPDFFEKLRTKLQGK